MLSKVGQEKWQKIKQGPKMFNLGPQNWCGDGVQVTPPPQICTCRVYFTEEALRKTKFKSIQRKKNTVASLKGIWHVSLKIN